MRLKRYIISKYRIIFSKINKLEHSHHLTHVEEILGPCHDLPSDRIYNKPIRRLASKALKLLFKLISLKNPDSTCLPNNSNKHWCLKEIGCKETIESDGEYIELGDLFFRFESNSGASAIHIQNTKETFFWNSMDLLSKYNIKLETLAKKIKNYCPITVEGCKRQNPLSRLYDLPCSNSAVTSSAPNTSIRLLSRPRRVIGSVKTAKPHRNLIRLRRILLGHRKRKFTGAARLIMLRTHRHRSLLNWCP